MHTHKLLFIGAPGAGKTTAIAAASDAPPLCTDVPSSEEDRYTTVALDFGEVTLDDDTRLGVYGVPGQPRFDFLWPILAPGTLGVALLLDARDGADSERIDWLVAHYRAHLAEAELLLAVTHLDQTGVAPLASFRDAARARGLNCPVLPLDARKPDQVQLLLRVLIARIEAHVLLP
jgi:signal recognition particle receptor subunit beta